MSTKLIQVLTLGNIPSHDDSTIFLKLVPLLSESEATQIDKESISKISTPDESETTAAAMHHKPAVISPPSIVINNSPTKEVVITNEKSLTDIAYSVMQTQIIIETNEAISIAKSTADSMHEIEIAVVNAKVSAVTYIKLEYDAIVKDLSKFDATKEELERQTEDLITTMDKVKESYTIVKQTINDTIIVQAELDKET